MTDTFKRKIQEEMIMHYFYTRHDNRDAVIAKYFGLNTTMVTAVIARHLDKKMERINERINKET